MKYDPGKEIIVTCHTDNFGGRKWNDRQEGMKALTILVLIWRLIRIFFKYGNGQVYYHICGSLGKDCYDVPMDAENVEVRLTVCGPKVTIW